MVAFNVMFGSPSNVQRRPLDDVPLQAFQSSLTCMVAEVSVPFAVPERLAVPPCGHSTVSLTDAIAFAIAFATAALDGACTLAAGLPTLNAPTADIASSMSAICSSLRFAF